MKRFWISEPTTKLRTGFGFAIAVSKRQKVICLTLCAMVVAFSLAADAQQHGKIPRIGLLVPGSSAFPTSTNHESFRQGLRELGYIEGKNVLIEIRYAKGKQDQLSNFATELANSKVDVIVTSTTPGVLAAKKATNAIPIVFAAVGDPVKAGLVSSLARPGGNITGLSTLNPELLSKRLELLKEAFPKITKVAYFRDATLPRTGSAETRASASALGLQVQFLDVRSTKDLDDAFEATLKEPPQALITSAGPVIGINLQRIVAFAAKNQLPAIYPDSRWIDAVV